MASKQIITGLERLTLENEFGEELGVVTYNPNDAPGIIKRAHEMQKKYENFSVDLDGEFDIDKLERIEREICSILDYVFGTPVSKTAFKAVSPVTMLPDGSYVFENVFYAFLDEVKQKADASAQASKKRIGKYTSKYVN